MTTTRNIGRIIGVLLLAKMVVSPVINFALLGPAITSPPGFLANAASYPMQVNAAVLLAFMAGGLTIAVPIVAWPLFRQCSQSLALWFLALGVVCVSVAVVEGIAVRAMLALSQEFAKAGGAAAVGDLFQASATVVRSLRNSAHYANLLASGVSFLVLFLLLFRYALVPRAISALGLVATTVLIGGAVIPLLGFPTVMSMFTPMGLAMLALVSWLLYKGFADRRDGAVTGAPLKTAAVP
jgi:hypothetical protein